MPTILNSGADTAASFNATSMRGVQVAGLANGGYVATWFENSTTVYARIYGADNKPLTAPFVVSGAVANSGNPVIAALDDGTFVIAWTGTGNGIDVFGRHFDADGTPMNNPVVLNSFVGTPGNQTAPTITGLGSTFLLAYKEPFLSGGVLSANFLPDGTPVALNGSLTDSIFNLFNPAITGHADGSFGAVAIGDPLNSGFYRVYADIGVTSYGSSSSTNNRIQVSNDADGNLAPSVPSDIAELDDGTFIIVWTQGATSDVFYRHVAANGAYLNDPTRLTNGTSTLAVKVAALADGGFEIAWSLNAAQASILGQRFDANGGPVTPVLTLCAGDANHLYVLSDITALNDGGFVLSGGLSLAGNFIGLHKAFVGATSLNGSQSVFGTVDPDLMDGGSGADKMYGGMGDDTYIVNSAGDTIYDTGGRDTVMAGVTTTLADNLETLILTGHASINGTGNQSGNLIIGNDGNNTLLGGAGNDTFRGGDGNDVIITYGGNDYADGGAGNDVMYSLGNGAAVLSGGDGEDTIGGDLGDDKVYGGNNDDTIWASVGRDYAYGDAGSDTLDGYFLASSMSASLLVNRAWLGGTSTTLLSGIENLTGSNFADILQGDNNDNILNGGAGADRLNGGGGDDIYVVDNAGDQVSEILGGTDQGGYDIIRSYISLTIAANIEELDLMGGADIDATGDNSGNILVGNSGNNQLDGRAGNDTMYGGAGNDTYIVDSTGDVASEELLGPGYNSGGIDEVRTTVTLTTIGDFIENLTLLGSVVLGRGNELDNIITGNSGGNNLYGEGGNDTLDGGAGADQMGGGQGNDTYIVDNIADVVNETMPNSGGYDTIRSSVTYTLPSVVEVLFLTGNLSVNGTGNDVGNFIGGNNGVNTLYGLGGNDYLDGAAGADTMFGGAGDDTYVVNTSNDVVREDTVAGIDDGGVDTVASTVSYTLGSFLENLFLDGPTALVGTGNSLDNVITGEGAANTLRGLGGNDTLDGGTNGDRMYGGSGNDTYYVDDSGDIISESTTGGVDDGGYDLVIASVSYTLTNFVERLELDGSDNIDGTGNNLSNVIIGNSGNNLITGGVGTDLLTGNGGADTFKYALGSSGLDYIYDFATGVDKLMLSGFGFAAGYTLTATEFRVNAGPVGTNAQFFYNPNNNLLYYDANGTLAGGLVAFIHMDAPGAGDFVFI